MACPPAGLLERRAGRSISGNLKYGASWPAKAAAKPTKNGTTQRARCRPVLIIDQAVRVIGTTAAVILASPVTISRSASSHSVSALRFSLV